MAHAVRQVRRAAQPLYERELDETSALLEAALPRDDAWEGLVWFFERFGERAAADPSVAATARLLSGAAFPTAHRYLTMWRGLLARATADGLLRPDVTYADVGFLTTSLATVIRVTEGRLPGFWRRHLQLLLDGLRCPGGGLPDLAIGGSIEEALARSERIDDARGGREDVRA